MRERKITRLLSKGNPMSLLIYEDDKYALRIPTEVPAPKYVQNIDDISFPSSMRDAPKKFMASTFPELIVALCYGYCTAIDTGLTALYIDRCLTYIEGEHGALPHTFKEQVRSNFFHLPNSEVLQLLKVQKVFDAVINSNVSFIYFKDDKYSEDKINTRAYQFNTSHQPLPLQVVIDGYVKYVNTLCTPEYATDLSVLPLLGVKDDSYDKLLHEVEEIALSLDGKPFHFRISIENKTHDLTVRKNIDDTTPYETVLL